MPFKIVRNDITKMKVDVIVNTANNGVRYSSGVDSAVYHAAGVEDLLKEREKIGRMNEGEVAITSGFKLPAKYIIHAVSPRYKGGNRGEDELLRSCYSKSLQLAYQNKCDTIAFPLISTGCFGYPKEEAMRIALDEINTFLLTHEMMVYLVVFDAASTKLGFNVYPDLEAYIDSNYVCNKNEEEYGYMYFGGEKEPEENILKRSVSARGLSKYRKRSSVEHTNKKRVDEVVCEMSIPDIQSEPEADDKSYEGFFEEHESALKERMKHLSDTFQQYLFYLIEQKKLTPSEVYKRAIISKQLFSKIKLNPDYHPDKATAMRLCVGAKLNIDETKDLLGRAGYALSPCDKRDIIFSFFIENQVYDMIEIDIALEEHDLPCFIE